MYQRVGTENWQFKSLHKWTTIALAIYWTLTYSVFLWINLNSLALVPLMRVLFTHSVVNVVLVQFIVFNMVVRSWFGQLNMYLLQCFSMCTEDDLNVRVTEALQSSSVKKDTQHDTHVTIRQIHVHEMPTVPKAEILSIRPHQNTSNCVEILLTRNSCTLLRKLRAVYSLLYQAVTMVNSAYGIQNLIVITSCLMSIVVYMYAITFNLFSSNNGLYGDRTHTIVRISLWTGLLVWRIIGICYSSEVVIREANHTQRLVTKLQMLSLPASCGVQEELQLFGEQLACSPPHYSASGFFTLDLTLLKSIVAAVTTYSVILIQFSHSDTNMQLR
ncbi:putative gustatory receptor 28b [Schistocerca gregaria]|uniref:putative gustatory receptor 28b n=1 Tax=Schistocerca gregaria TaxID=7010 RepID=UPI00211E658E|nr:putative gustatory receptor 28b [Schistocerca gregaria]